VLKLKQKLGGFDFYVEPLKSPLMFFKRCCRFHHGGMLVKIEVVFQDPFCAETILKGCSTLLC